jgi:5-methylcytosine-specific restriction endonuclease McrA
MAKKRSRSSIVKQLDSMFSKFIRNRDSDGELCTCSTCGVQKPIKQMQAGHFMSRSKYSTRWDEENVHAQCAGCNMWKQGQQYLMSIHIDQKYYPGKADELLRKSNGIEKFSDAELIEKTKHYKNLLK